MMRSQKAVGNTEGTVVQIPFRSEFVFPISQGILTLDFDLDSRVRDDEDRRTRTADRVRGSCSHVSCS